MKNLIFLKKNQFLSLFYTLRYLVSFAREKGRFWFLPRWGKIVWKLKAQKALFTAGLFTFEIQCHFVNDFLMKKNLFFWVYEFMS